MSASPNADHDLKHVSSRDKAEILAQALPYIRKFHGKTIVITPLKKISLMPH